MDKARLEVIIIIVSTRQIVNNRPRSYFNTFVVGTTGFIYK